MMQGVVQIKSLVGVFSRQTGHKEVDKRSTESFSVLLGRGGEKMGFGWREK